MNIFQLITGFFIFICSLFSYRKGKESEISNRNQQENSLLIDKLNSAKEAKKIEEEINNMDSSALDSELLRQSSKD